jgi:hypothetical protein
VEARETELPKKPAPAGFFQFRALIHYPFETRPMLPSNYQNNKSSHLSKHHAAEKKLVVWYKGGAGGFLVAWLLQVAFDHRYLDASLQVFPESLGSDSGSWTQHEKTPSSVAVLCNPFHPDVVYQVDQEQEIRDVIEMILSGDSSSMDNLLYCRIKMYLCNYVYETGHPSKTLIDRVNLNHHHWHLEDLSLVKSMTDVLFEPEKNIFVIAPDRYCELAAKFKGSRFYSSPINQIVSQYPALKKFHIETVWKGTWLQELESVLGFELGKRSKNACEQLISRYLDIMPDEMKAFCNHD